MTPFEQTVAFRRFGGAVDPEPDSPEEVYTKALTEEQGFDGLPHVIERRVLDQYVGGGEVEVYRGVTSARYANEFRHGSFFVGRGSYGSGAYTAAGSTGFATAKGYTGSEGAILRMAIKGDARIAGIEQIESDAFRAREAIIRVIRLNEQRATDAVTHGRETDVARIRLRFDALVSVAHATYDDLGRYGAFLGFDALYIPDENFYLILNRSAVRVQAENLR